MKVLRDLRDFFADVWWRVSEGHFGLVAAGCAFFAMFAVFPGLTATIAIWSLMADPAAIRDYLAVAERFLPPDAAQLIDDQVMSLLTTPRGTVGWASAISIAVALFSARAGVSALIQGLQVVHRTSHRNLLWGYAVEIMMTLALIFALFVGLVTIVAVPLALSYVELGPIEAWVLRVLPWVAMFLLVLTCLSILYRFGPNLQGVETRWVSVGVLVAAVVWSLVSLAFSTYLANFDSYNRIYGSIGAVIALLMWLYLSVWSVLLGGAINAELTARNSRWRRSAAPSRRSQR